MSGKRQKDREEKKIQKEYDISKFSTQVFGSSVWPPESVISRETLKIIFYYLDIATLGICTGVCKSWYQVGNENTFWEKLSMCFYNYSQPPKNGWKKRVISRFLFQNKLKLLLRINQDILGIENDNSVVVTPEKIQQIEKELGVTLPDQFVDFLSVYSGLSIFHTPLEIIETTKEYWEHVEEWDDYGDEKQKKLIPWLKNKHWIVIGINNDSEPQEYLLDLSDKGNIYWASFYYGSLMFFASDLAEMIDKYVKQEED